MKRPFSFENSSLRLIRPARQGRKGRATNRAGSACNRLNGDCARIHTGSLCGCDDFGSEGACGKHKRCHSSD
ncbi:hypothetical protein APV28_0395 [Comamonas testosteroni]|nr:hypothetical protein APV28_0395 [Comamonas testosteroni]